MNDILLVNPPMWSPAEQRWWSAESPHLGLGYLAACLLRAGLSVRIADLSVSRDPDADLMRSLEETQARIVGVTGLTQNWHRTSRVARVIKAMDPGIHVVVGGPHVSYTWQESLADENIDTIALFEAEETLVELCRAIATDGDRGAIAGLAFRVDGRPVRTKPRPRQRNLDLIPHPARHLLPMAAYRRPGTIMTSRGCPEKCIFCISSTFEGAYRMRSAADVVAELAALRSTWDIREVYFLDNVFTVDPDRVRAICDGIRRLRLGITFNCVSRANLVTEEVIGWLKSAGCERIEIGVESGSQQNIDAFNKHITIDQVRRAADIVLGAGLRPMFTFQIGAPDDTEATLDEGHRLALELRQMGAITFFSIMTPYPGTPLLLQAEKLGLRVQTRDWREYRTSNPVFDTRHLERNDFRMALFRESVPASQAGEPGLGPASG